MVGDELRAPFLESPGVAGVVEVTVSQEDVETLKSTGQGDRETIGLRCKGDN